jgi:hypothetical protein
VSGGREFDFGDVVVAESARPQQVAEDLFPRLPAAAAVDSDIV